MNAKPMNPLILLLLNVAHAVAPKSDKLWLNDMRLEARFVQNKLRFALAALGLACKFRFTALRLNRPVGIAFASVALAALATFLVVPRLFVEDTTTAAMSPLPNTNYESVQDLAEERGYSAAAQDAAEIEAETQTAQAAIEPATTDTATTDTAQDVVAEAVEETTSLARVSPQAEVPAESSDSSVAEVPAPLATITPPEPLESAIPASPVPPPAETSPVDAAATNSTDTLSQASPSEDAVLLDSEVSEATTEQSATATLPTLPEPATPSVDAAVISTQVKGESVNIEVVADTLLTLYRDTNFSGSPRTHRYVTAGESFVANVPFSLYTNNAAAIKVTLDGESYNLGEENEEQFRIFSKP